MTATTPLLRVVVLVSGRGSNLKAIAARADAGELPVHIEAVVSDRADAGALEWARARGIATSVLSPADFPDRDSYGRALGDIVESHAPQLVVLAGFMRILSDEFVQRFSAAMLNIHPSLLPQYAGLHTHRRALEAGDREHGASVHFRYARTRRRPGGLTGQGPILPGDDEDSLAARVLREEHVIYRAASAGCGGSPHIP